jgi:coproporphyrinogen III oxidase
MTETLLAQRQTQAKAWFESLQDKIIASFEALEDAADMHLHPDAPKAPGRFERKPWTRDNHDGARSPNAASSVSVTVRWPGTNPRFE